MKIVCVHVLQLRLFAYEKDYFYKQLLTIVTSVIPSKALIIAGDFIVHIGQHSQGFNRHHGGCSYGTRNQEGTRIIYFHIAPDLAVTNKFSRKRISQLIPYNSGGCANQVDCNLVGRTGLKPVKYAKVIGNKECIQQLKLLVAVFKI